MASENRSRTLDPNAKRNSASADGPREPGFRAIYVYDRMRQAFYMLSFEGAEDNLTVGDFSELLDEYRLLRFTEQPSLLQARFHSAGSA